MARRPADAPPLNAFFVYRGNKVHSNGGFSLGADKVITPGLTAADTAEWAGNSWAVSPPTMLQPPALACVAV